MVVRLLLSSLPGLSLFPQNNISVFSQKIAFLRGSLLQKKSPACFLFPPIYMATLPFKIRM